MAEFTLAQIFDAIEQDGYPQAIGHYEKMEENGEVSYCAMGQASLNLGFPNPDKVGHALNGPANMTNDYARAVWNDIVLLNDSKRLPLDKIAEQLRIIYIDHLEETVII